jgi:hypothetical protein
MTQLSNATPGYLADEIGSIRAEIKEMQEVLDARIEDFKRLGEETVTGELYYGSISTGDRRTLDTKAMKEKLDPAVLEPFWRTEPWVRVNTKKLFQAGE